MRRQQTSSRASAMADSSSVTFLGGQDPVQVAAGRQLLNPFRPADDLLGQETAGGAHRDHVLQLGRGTPQALEGGRLFLAQPGQVMQRRVRVSRSPQQQYQPVHRARRNRGGDPFQVGLGTLRVLKCDVRGQAGHDLPDGQLRPTAIIP